MNWCDMRGAELSESLIHGLHFGITLCSLQECLKHSWSEIKGQTYSVGEQSLIFIKHRLCGRKKNTVTSFVYWISQVYENLSPQLLIRVWANAMLEALSPGLESSLVLSFGGYMESSLEGRGRAEAGPTRTPLIAPLSLNKLGTFYFSLFFLLGAAIPAGQGDVLGHTGTFNGGSRHCSTDFKITPYSEGLFEFYLPI